MITSGTISRVNCHCNNYDIGKTVVKFYNGIPAILESSCEVNGTFRNESRA